MTIRNSLQPIAVSTALLFAVALPFAVAQGSADTTKSFVSAQAAHNSFKQAQKLLADRRVEESENMFRSALNEQQLALGFAADDVPQILDGLAQVLTKQKKNEEAQAASELAKSIRAGSWPHDFSTTVEMRENKDLLVRKRLHSPLGKVGCALFVLKETDDGYKDFLNSLGSMQPGQAKPLPPVEDSINWAEACGITDAGTKQVAIVEHFVFKYRAADGVKTLQLTNKESAWTTAHTLAHTLDNLKGRSHSDEFRKAYLSDGVKLSVPDRARLAYFLQKGDAGCEETYAEAYCALSGGEHEHELDALFLKSFPNSIKLIESQRQSAE